MPDPAAGDAMFGFIGGGAGILTTVAYLGGKFFDWQKARAKAAQPVRPSTPLPMTMEEEYSDSPRNVRIELRQIDGHVKQTRADLSRDIEALCVETRAAHHDLSASQAEVAASLDSVARHTENMTRILSDIHVDVQVLRQTANGGK